MDKKFFIFIFSILSLNFFSQNILNEIVLKENFIVVKEKLLIKNHLDHIDYEDVLEYYNQDNELKDLDKNIFKEFKSKLKNEKSGFWNDFDFENSAYLTSFKEKLNLDSIKILSKKLNYSVEKQKQLIREIKTYNANINQFRYFPLMISEPIYSEDKKHLIIGISHGNNGGEIRLYQKQRNSWVFVLNISRWAY